jgi:hypothetical protein
MSRPPLILPRNSLVCQIVVGQNETRRNNK